MAPISFVCAFRREWAFLPRRGGLWLDHLYPDRAPTPSEPYLSWETAATNIQDAVDFATPGDTVLAADGSYGWGARVSPDGATNRVVVTNAITLQSLNGAASTRIDGGGSVRCLYLAEGATLCGLKPNGAASKGAGLYAASTNTFIRDCVLTKNVAAKGGGALMNDASYAVFPLKLCPLLQMPR